MTLTATAAVSQAVMLCDVDGVLANFAELLMKVLYRPIEDAETITEYDLQKTLSPEEHERIVRLLEMPIAPLAMAPHDDALRFVQAARAQNIQVLAMTSCPLPWVASRTQWLAECFDFHSDEILFIPRDLKKLVRGDMLVEDHLPTVAEWIDLNPKGSALLVDRPWNRSATLPPRTRRISLS